MPTPVLGSQIYEVIPTIQAAGVAGGDPITVSAGGTIPSLSGASGVPSTAPTYGTGTLYVDTTNYNLYVYEAAAWHQIVPAASSTLTLSSLTATNITYTGIVSNSNATYTAAGTTQATATALTVAFCYVNAGTGGVVLPSSGNVQIITVYNDTANSINIYPATGQNLQGLATNIPFVLPAYAVQSFDGWPTWQYPTPIITGSSNISATWGSYATALAGTLTLALTIPQVSTIAASAAINGSSGEVLIGKILVGTAPVAGDAYNITIFGTCSIVSATAEQSTFRVRVGTAGTTADTVVFATLQPTSSAAVISNIPFMVEMLLTFRSATSVIVSGALTNQGTTGISTAVSYVSVSTGATAITNANNYIDVTYAVAGTTSVATTFQQVTINKVR